MSNYEIREITIHPGYTVFGRFDGQLRAVETFDKKPEAEGFIETLEALELARVGDTIQVQARCNTPQQVKADIDECWRRPSGVTEDRNFSREITPESAVAIASWWMRADLMPGPLGRVLGAFAEGEEVDRVALLADIQRTRDANPEDPRGAFDVYYNVNALDYLLTFIINQPAGLEPATNGL
jgi:hypothetical protein